MATVLLLVIYLAFIGLGLPDSLLGSAWPVIHGELGVPVGLAGLTSVVTTVGTVYSSLLSERAIRRFGTGRVAAFSVLLTALALFGVSVSHHFIFMLLMALPLGLGGGAIDTALNNYVALHYKSNHMNWLHCFWGVGATASPALMALFLSKGNWRGGYFTVALALIGIAGVLAVSLPLWKRCNGVGSAAAAQPGMPLSRRELLRRPGAFYSCLAFFAYCAAETSTGLWASTYFVTVRGVAAETAAAWASTFFLGITAGRLLSGFAALKYSDRTLIRTGQAAILAGLLFLLPPLASIPPVVGLFLMGLGCAPVFPCMLDETPKLFGAEFSQGIMGLQFACAYCGSSLMSPLFGLISRFTGMRTLPVYLLALVLLQVFSTRMVHAKSEH